LGISMANRRKEEAQTNGHGKGKIKFRYTDSERTLDFSVEDLASDSVTEGLRSIANVLAGRVIASDQVARRPKPKPALAGSTTIDPEAEVETPEQEVLESEEVETNEDASEGDETPKPKRVVKLKAPKLLSTPNLTEAALPLSDFVKQKNPQDMMDKYSVIAVWYKEQFQIEEMDIDRIFSAFKFLGIESQLPTDVLKPLRNLSYNRKWFDKSKTKPNTFTLNWVGESEVGKMGTAAGAAKA
jgi:hypothetical protein